MNTEAEAKVSKWKLKFPRRTRQELIDYGKSIGKPAYDYYNKQFQDEGGDLVELRKRGLACKLFDPFFLKVKEGDVERLKGIASGLIHFEYKEFDNDFVEGLEREIPLAVEHANREFDWSTIEESKEYKTRTDRKNKKEKAGKLQ